MSLEFMIMNSLICLHFHSFLFHSVCSKAIYGKGKSNIYPYVVSGQSHFSQEIYNIVQVLNILNEFLLVLKYKHKVNFKGKKSVLTMSSPFVAHLRSEGGKYSNSTHRNRMSHPDAPMECSSVFITR